MNNCLQCNSPTKNPKYCSRSCSAKANNKGNCRHSVNNSCKECGDWIKSGRSYCSDCFKTVKIIQWDNLTLGQVRGERLYQKNSRIRENARMRFLSTGIKACQICEYDKHIEIHHIKSISSFPLDTTIREINHLDNLVGLCPNCHWEVENDLASVYPLSSKQVKG